MLRMLHARQSDSRTIGYSVENNKMGVLFESVFEECKAYNRYGNMLTMLNLGVLEN